MSSLDSLNALKMFLEPLDPALMPFVRHDTSFPMVHHPLVISPLASLDTCGHINKIYKHKTRAVEEARIAEDWRSYIALHERPYRLDALLDAIEEGIPTNTLAYWDLVRWVWTDSENIHQNYDEWYDIWKAVPILDDTEIARREKLLEITSLWRGIWHRRWRARFFVDD